MGSNFLWLLLVYLETLDNTFHISTLKTMLELNAWFSGHLFCLNVATSLFYGHRDSQFIRDSYFLLELGPQWRNGVGGAQSRLLILAQTMSLSCFSRGTGRISLPSCCWEVTFPSCCWEVTLRYLLYPLPMAQSQVTMCSGCHLQWSWLMRIVPMSLTLVPPSLVGMSRRGW